MTRRRSLSEPDPLAQTRARSRAQYRAHCRAQSRRTARALGRTWDHGSLRPLAGESPERMRVSPPSPASQPVQQNRARPLAQDARPAPAHTDQAVIRNFCIIAHIDHGKSTLADRMLQLTGVVEGRQMRAQYLDRMDIERERGITIKSQAVRLPWASDGTQYVLNLIDTPGHVDFSYEVSRSLAACEGAVLLVDAAQGIEAQTLANLYLALDADLKIIPVLNKIDLPAAQPDRYAAELAGIIGCDPAEVLRVRRRPARASSTCCTRSSGSVPAPSGNPDAPARALIFDSIYDTYRGVVTYVRVVDGRLSRRERSLMMSTGGDPRDARGGRDLAGAHAERGPGRGGGRLPDHRGQGRPAGPGRRYRDQLRPPGGRTAGRLLHPQADGLLRPVPGGRRRLPRPARRTGQAAAQRRRAAVRAGDERRARVRLPLRLPRPAAHGDRPRAPGARIRPVPDLHLAERRLPRRHGHRPGDPGDEPE